MDVSSAVEQHVVDQLRPKVADRARARGGAAWTSAG